MGMNDAELTCVIDELAGWVGEPMTGAWQPRRDRVVIGVGRSWLLLVPRGPDARIHSVNGRPRNPGNPFSFQGACRAHLRAPLRAVHKVDDDRIVALTFGDTDLHLRLTGRSGGLWIVQGRQVLAAYDGPAPDVLPAPPPPPDAPRTKGPRFTPGPGESWNEAARHWFTEREAARTRAERRRLLRKRLKTRMEREQRLRRALDQDLAKADRGPEARSRADAVAARLHEIRRGDHQVTVPDLEEPGHVWTVDLDPKRSPGENLERLYGRARRLDRMGERVLEHMERVEERIRALDAALHVVDEADDATLDRLEALAPRSRRQQKTPSAEDPWHTWIGPRGQQVLVGRHARGNRRLTFQRARGDDFWLHLRGRPGAHLLVPMQSGKTADLDTLLAAAQIALVHARVPEGMQADVQYTRARHVRSIKGAPDGRVQVLSEKVLRVARDPSHLVGWRRADQDVFDADALQAASEQPDRG